MKKRLYIFLYLLLVIVIGLASRKYSGLFPEIFDKYPGDALWAVAVYLGWKILWPNTGLIKIAALALITSWSVEFSQIYHAPWIDEIRNNAVGHLFLGSTFNAIDLVAYLVGVGVVFAVDIFLDNLRRDKLLFK